jgi:hypothetical protein
MVMVRLSICNPGFRLDPGANRAAKPASQRGCLARREHNQYSCSRGTLFLYSFSEVKSQMNHRTLSGTVLAALLVGSALATEPTKSGPQVGKQPGAFNPLHLTGPDAGTKNCLV